MGENIVKKRLTGIIKFIRYSLIGGVCTGINLLLFIFLVYIGVHYVIANAASYLTAVAINYILAGHFVFEDCSGHSAVNKLFRFFLVRLGNLAVDTVSFYLLVSVMHMNMYAARVGLTGAGVIISYVLARRFVYRGDET